MPARARQDIILTILKAVLELPLGPFVAVLINRCGPHGVFLRRHTLPSRGKNSFPSLAPTSIQASSNTPPKGQGGGGGLWSHEHAIDRHGKRWESRARDSTGDKK